MVGAVAFGGALAGFLASVFLHKTVPQQIAEEGNLREEVSTSPYEEFPTPRLTQPFSLPALPDPDAVQTAINRADAFLEEENPSQALEILIALKQSGIENAQLILRRAICNEELRNFTAAHDLYRELARQSDRSVLRDAARVSQARVLQNSGQDESALAILSAALVASDERVTAVGAEASHLFSQLLLKSTSGGQRPELKVASDSWSPSSRRVISSVSSVPGELKGNGNPEFRVVSQFGTGADSFQLAVRHPLIPVPRLIETASQTTGVDITVSKKTEQLLRSRTLRIARSSVSLAELLDLVSLPFGLIWIEQNDQIAIVVETELSPKDLVARRSEITVRTLRTALSTWPAHELAPVTWISLANLQAQRNETDAALSLYSQFLREFPKSPLAATAWFNKSIVEAKNGQYEDALDSMYRVVDGFSGHPLESKVWLQIGRLKLNADELDESIRPLVRAATTAHDQHVQAEAANTLAQAYILLKKNHAASMVLMDYRDAIRRDPHSRVAAMLGTLARFRVATGVRKEGEGQRLISALANLRTTDYEQDSLRLLAGQAWRELGLHDQMASLYRASIEATADSQLRRRMLFELGDWLRVSGAAEEAEAMLKQIGAGDDKWAQRARESQAQIQLAAGNTKGCIKIALNLLKQSSNEESSKRRLLELLGRAYEAQGDYTLAAQCFSGIIPGLVMASAREKSHD